MKACVLDDDHTSLALLSDFLKDEGWEVVMFTHPDRPSESGTRLDKELSDERTELLIMDVRFGREDDGLIKGLNAARTLAEQKMLISGSTVVFVSQFGRDSIQTDDVEDTLGKNGVHFYWLDKPVDFVHLKDIIRQYQ